MDARDYYAMTPDEKTQLSLGLLGKLGPRSTSQHHSTTNVEPLSRAEMQLLAASTKAASMRIATSHPDSPSSST